MQPSEHPVDPLQALVEGDPGPFEAFVQQQTPLFLAFFRRLGARPSDAEDLTQDVMLRLFRHADAYQGRGQVEAYAFRVARNAWIDFRRRASVRPKPGTGSEEGIQPEPVGSEPAPDEAVLRAESSAELYAVIATLGATQREAFRLGVVEGRPYTEIAETLGIPVGTVKSRVFHAVQKLRARLAGSWPGAQEDSGSQGSPHRAGGRNERS